MITCKDITPVRDSVLALDLEAGEQKTSGGIIVMDDNMKDTGIHPRWCKIFRAGPDATQVKAGQWALVDHGRWTHGFEANIDGNEGIFRWLDYADILLVTDEKPGNFNTI